MKKLLSIIISSMAFTSMVYGDGHISTVFGIGTTSCGKYISEVSADGNAKSAYGWWVSGFVSGTNMVKGRIVSTDSAAHEAWLKNYCEQYPLDSFVAAASRLNKELDNK